MTASSDAQSDGRPVGRGRVAVALVVCSALLLGTCWALVPLLARYDLAELDDLLLGTFALAAALVWLTPGLARRRSSGPGEHRPRPWVAVAHGLAAVLITAAWLATTVFLCILAAFAVWKTSATSLAPLFGIVGFLGLTGSLDLLHRTVAPEIPRRVTLTTSVLTSGIGGAVLLVVTGPIPAVRSPMPPSEQLLLGIIAVGGPILAAVVGVVVVRRAASRRRRAAAGGNRDETFPG